MQGGSHSSRKVAEEALGSRGEAVELDKRERQRKALLRSCGQLQAGLVASWFPAIRQEEGFLELEAELLGGQNGRPRPHSRDTDLLLEDWCASRGSPGGPGRIQAVSYTHLTLPTKA